MKKYSKKIKSVKLECRSELKYQDWSRNGYSDRDWWLNFSRDRTIRISVNSVSKQEFIDNYESKSIPVVINGIIDDWHAKNWSAQYLLQKYKYEKFRVGEDDDGKPVYLGLKYFLHYALEDPNGAAKDDSPLYIFDGSFASRRQHYSAKRKPGVEKEYGTKSQAPCHLAADYSVPEYFNDDLFHLTGNRRPPYRWIVIGPARSGTGIHVDPLGTSAWNALIQGHKRWALFPPGTPKHIYDPPGLKDHEATTWFATVYPTLANNAQVLEKFPMLEILQRPGETVFVPGGWAHVVMNLDFSIAVTQNYCSPTNLETVWLKTRFSRPRLASKLRRIMYEYKVPTGVSKKQKPFKKLSKSLKCLDTIPALPTSSSSNSTSSSSSSSSSESGCECHKLKSKKLEQY